MTTTTTTPTLNEIQAFLLKWHESDCASFVIERKHATYLYVGVSNGYYATIVSALKREFNLTPNVLGSAVTFQTERTGIHFSHKDHTLLITFNN